MSHPGKTNWQQSFSHHVDGIWHVVVQMTCDWGNNKYKLLELQDYLRPQCKNNLCDILITSKKLINIEKSLFLWFSIISLLCYSYIFLLWKNWLFYWKKCSLLVCSFFAFSVFLWVEFSKRNKKMFLVDGFLFLVRNIRIVVDISKVVVEK